LAFEYFISNKGSLDFKLITTMSAAKFVSSCRNVCVAARRSPVSRKDISIPVLEIASA
jgi:hypothetical protein